MSNDLLQRGKAIKLAVFDVDGVLTDGRLYFLEDGSEFKTFNTLDGQGDLCVLGQEPLDHCFADSLGAAGDEHPFASQS